MAVDGLVELIQIRRDTADNWAQSNPVLAQGEIGADLTGRQFRMGDGTAAWNDLSIWGGSDLYNAVEAASVAAAAASVAATAAQNTASQALTLIQGVTGPTDDQVGALIAQTGTASQTAVDARIAALGANGLPTGGADGQYLQVSGTTPGWSDLAVALAQISDMTSVGRSVGAAPDAASARSALQISDSTAGGNTYTITTSDASAARVYPNGGGTPVSTDRFIWVCPSQPVNMADNDIWLSY